jgi:hypothetical protein
VLAQAAAAGRAVTRNAKLMSTATTRQRIRRGAAIRDA